MQYEMVFLLDSKKNHSDNWLSHWCLKLHRVEMSPFSSCSFTSYDLPFLKKGNSFSYFKSNLGLKINVQFIGKSICGLLSQHIIKFFI